SGGGKTLSATRLFTNNGIIAWSAGNIGECGSATFTNAGTINLTGDAGFTWSVCAGSPVINNTMTGIINKTGGSGTSTLSDNNGITFNNDGQVNVLSGTISTGANGTHHGTFSVASGKTLSFVSNCNQTLLSGASITGTGNVLFASGTVT